MAISIKAARVNAGFTQEEVAKAIKKSKNTIVSYEAYTSSPDINVAIAMAKLFQMPVDDIVWDKD
jgi:DNA-binding XRE family transcriptional regulator